MLENCSLFGFRYATKTFTHFEKQQYWNVEMETDQRQRPKDMYVRFDSH